MTKTKAELWRRGIIVRYDVQVPSWADIYVHCPSRSVRLIKHSDTTNKQVYDELYRWIDQCEPVAARDVSAEDVLWAYTHDFGWLGI